MQVKPGDSGFGYSSSSLSFPLSPPSAYPSPVFSFHHCLTPFNHIKIHVTIPHNFQCDSIISYQTSDSPKGGQGQSRGVQGREPWASAAGLSSVCTAGAQGSVSSEAVLNTVDTYIGLPHPLKNRVMIIDF